jgi:hypothetical protein
MMPIQGGSGSITLLYSFLTKKRRGGGGVLPVVSGANGVYIYRTLWKKVEFGFASTEMDPNPPK